MSKLEVLYVHNDWSFTPDHNSGLLSLIQLNTATLRVLYMDSCLPVPDNVAKYERLETIRCDVLSDEVRALCPVLKDVKERLVDDWNDGSISGGEEFEDWLADNGIEDEWYGDGGGYDLDEYNGLLEDEYDDDFM